MFLCPARFETVGIGMPTAINKVMLVYPKPCTEICGLEDLTKAMQQIMGHTDYAFTANEYTNANIAELKKAIDKM